MDESATRPDVLNVTPYDLGFGRLFWSIQDAVIVGDAANGRVVLWSPSAEELFGFSRDEIVGRPIEVLVPDDFKEQHRSGLARYATSGEGELTARGQPVELLARRKDGVEIAIDLTLSPIAAPGFGDRLVMAIVRDVTERKRAQAEHLQLVREQAARAAAEEAIAVRDQFLTLAAHELRTPITVIKGIADLYLRRSPRTAVDPQRGTRLLGQLADATDRLAAITTDLLDVTRLRGEHVPLRLAPVDLGKLALEASAQFADRVEERGAPVVDAAEGCVVVCDQDRIKQVLNNLLDNALKYSPQGGRVAVTVSADDGGVVVSVHDEGIGLPSGATEEIFTPFGRAANATALQLPGLGLGLYLCREVVERHGGRIWAESLGEGQGMTVSVWLPCAGPEGGRQLEDQPPSTS